ncbi:MAG: DNA translocase FtsK [Pyrinomonadaceae bacterium]|nr:DNA translocase FtsK 4TM domain-containing protein [Blastocatellia bacterium]MDQ3219289.1 DNA translocase FtsK 4TM domain-containing protein [Acidobacteriota bacterium]MDQ3490072.1 DNA translocase FtsK 4TM domain-containing protein [Acidobacteriota bacterium]
MKTCPTCKETYKDDGLNFCLVDGATLLKKRSINTTAQSRTNEVFAVALLALAVLIFLCLVSYDPSDPTFNTASSQKIQNWIGVVGANFAELLMSIVGITAYLFPALLGLIAWRVFQSESLRPRISRVAGFVLFVAATSGLANLVGWHGGIAGAFFSFYSVYLLGQIGAGILLTTVLVASILLITNLTFLGFYGNFEMAWENLRVHFREWKVKRLKDRSEQINAAKERMEKRREARDERPLPATISISDNAEASIKTQKESKAAADTNLFVAVQEGTSRSSDDAIGDEPSVPTIFSNGKAPDTILSSEILSGELIEPRGNTGPIPIKPFRNTAQLNGDTVVENVEDDEPSELPQKLASYENYILPGSQLLTPAAPRIEQKEAELRDIATELASKTQEFNVAGKVVNICPGPVVTTYEFKPDPGVKYSRVTGLVDDLCLALKAESIRIDRIPGKAFVGIEVPNHQRETIQLRDVIESKKFKESDSLLTIALGKTIDGLNYVADLAKMPHLLIAGATGAGKSVGVNTLVVSILYKAKPDEVKFIMVDPKRLELGLYADIPHLATPIITDPKRAAVSLRWAVSEMERRYKYLAGWGVRNIDGYNVEAKRRNSLEQFDDNGDPHPTLPFIVIIIDELADLMMVSGKEVEEAITRLAQMARAVGIHLVLATQRPSVDVITGLIKANFPARISFRVSSKVDSRTIIDGNGAESLLGKGDMLFLPPASSQVLRVHGAYVDEKEIAKIVEHVKAQGNPEYDTTITKTEEELDDSGDLPGKRDPLFWDAVKSVVQAKRASTSLLQRHLRIGYGRAAAILDAMVKEGYIGDMDGSSRARPVLQKAYEDLQDISEMESN